MADQDFITKLAKVFEEFDEYWQDRQPYADDYEEATLERFMFWLAKKRSGVE